MRPARRLFLAIALPGPVKHALAALVTSLSDVRWTAEEQLHLTLRFLGDIEEDQTEALVARLAEVRLQKFLLPLEGVGSFPAKGPPRVLWCGVGKGHPILYQLRQRVDDAVLACGIPADLRTFHPHVTLARCGPKAANAVSAWTRKHREFTGPSFAVDAFELLASELTPTRAIYTHLKGFTLG